MHDICNRYRKDIGTGVKHKDSHDMCLYHDDLYHLVRDHVIKIT